MHAAALATGAPVATLRAGGLISFSHRADGERCYRSDSMWIFDCLGSTSAKSMEWITMNTYRVETGRRWPAYN